jgi:hypothetical protein
MVKLTPPQQRKRMDVFCSQRHIFELSTITRVPLPGPSRCAIGRANLRIDQVRFARCAIDERGSAIEPDRHAGFEAARITLRIEAQAQRIEIVVADRALGLPGREWPEWQQLGDDGRHYWLRA